MSEAVSVSSLQEPLALPDRFSALLDVGRRLAVAGSPAAVEAVVEDAALLLRGETCRLIHADLLGGSPSVEQDDALSRALVGRAVESGGPVVAGVADRRRLRHADVRAALAAPVLVHGEVAFCFYVSSTRIAQPFGEEEVRLAELIAAPAGAALEHLAGNEARLRWLAQNSGDVITLVSADGLVQYQSEAAGRVFGNNADSVIGRGVREWAHPDDMTRFVDALETATRLGEVHVECRLRHADGTFRHAETVVTNRLDVPHLAALVLNTRDVTDRRALEDELRDRARRDALTGLPNRALFLDRTQQALDRARRLPAPLVVAFLDLDDFKAVNDTYGHRAGDELLVEMSRRFVSCLRPNDTVARLGGDEFALLLEDTGLDTARTLVERLLATAAVPVTVEGEGDEVVVSLSAGLAPVRYGAHDADQLLVEADTAMDAAKLRGKHCYDIFVPTMRTSRVRRSRLRAELERALSREQFRLRYQPIVALDSGRSTGSEALLRWEHPTRGLLPPSEFIDFAEDSGQIVRMGSWVLTAACSAAVQMGPDARMNVNVSGRQLRSAALLGDVERALTESGLQPERLVLEITETATLGTGQAQVDDAAQLLLALKELGVGIALDDFGTGFSPLSHLRRFPVDLLKIDGSFVAGMTTSSHDEAIVRGVIGMAHDLGVRVIAEGVEQPAQLEALAALRCDYAQGYLLSRPVELSVLAERPCPPRPRDGSEREPAARS